MIIKIKFFVFVVYFTKQLACSRKYCNINTKHTLCKYEIAGPSPQCEGYDTNALLTEDDNKAILNKINERRNFIATGNSKYFPSAANMKKIVWSTELATFAQRWVDQCDQSLRPDKTDQCRDLDNLEVGQSIATIAGSTSHYNVKSFVEIWFMESMNYRGSVTYYNESQDHKTNRFTQLIWADTDKVGCGKAKFFVKNVKPLMVDRLVCNFAPKANIHRKPVYTIGYAATQCDSGMEGDIIFPGLCSHRTRSEGTFSYTTPPTASVLKIRNLFYNESAIQEIDPIYNNLKQMRKYLFRTGNHRHQVPMRDQNYMNNSNDSVKRSHPLTNRKIWSTQRQNNYGDIHKHEKGHSRVYHERRNEFDYLHQETFNNNMQRYEYIPTTAINLYIKQDYSKNNIDQRCSRKSQRKLTEYEATECTLCKKKLNQCTRGSKNKHRLNDGYQITQKYEDQEITTMRSNTRELCACNLFSSAYQSDASAQNINCNCANINYPSKSCPHMLRNLRDIYEEKREEQNDFQYDTISYIAQQSTSRSISKNSRISRDFSYDARNLWLPINKHLKNLNRRKQLKQNYSERSRRVAEEQENFKPFWQIDEQIYKNQPQLKSLKYTTLSYKKGQRMNTRKRPSTSLKTETITVALKEQSNTGKRVTEKYLSFDELLHLRKHNTDGGRRYYDENQNMLRESDTLTTTTESPAQSESASTAEDTPEYSFNTPYMRLKYCTRKLTCTWTAASLTDSAGSIIPGRGINMHGGSRTPPGYVEGCTRTSTCTRDYMNRNKMATIPVETTRSEPEPGDDGDYCERRSLNRRSYNNLFQGQNETTFKLSSLKQNFSFYNKSFNNCICLDNNRNKRQPNTHDDLRLKYKNSKRVSEKQIRYGSSLLSYDDLFYYVLSKIIDMWKTAKSSYSHEKCLCNCVHKISCCNFFLLLLILYRVIFIIF